MFTSGKTCITCLNPKPQNRFYSISDSSCKICRTLIKKGIILSKRTTVSRETLYNNTNPYRCVTCGKYYPWDSFPINSFECIHCNEMRHEIEYAQYKGFNMKIVCLVCEKEKDVQLFPNGGFICKTCIYKTNRYKKKSR